MNITKISNISFVGNIIDAHTHVGQLNNQKHSKEDLDIFVKNKLPNDDIVEKMLVSDLDVLQNIKNEYQGNVDLINTFKNDSHYALLASCNPKEGEVANIQRLYKKYPNTFVGLKFHPTLQELPVSSNKYTPYLEFANKHKIPCLFHSSVLVDALGKLTSNIEPYSDPYSIYKEAQKFPKLPVVIAHMGAGWNEAHDKTIDVLVDSIKKGDANLYADISWVDIDAAKLDNHSQKTHIIKAIKKLKGIGEKDWKYGDQTHRLLFGTDAPLARFKNKDAVKIYADFVEDIKFAIRNDKDLKKDAEEIIEKIFNKNSENLYLSQLKNPTKQQFINNKIKICLAAISVVCIGSFLYTKQSNKQSKNNAD